MVYPVVVVEVDDSSNINGDNNFEIFKPPADFDQLRIVDRGASNVLKLSASRTKALQAGQTVQFALSSHPGKGVGCKYTQPRTHKEWNYIETCGVDDRSTMIASIRYDDGFIRLSDARGALDLVLDVTSWKFTEGTPVNFVGGKNRQRTELHGGGRSFTINTDGTIALMKHPNLVLGFNSPGVWESPERCIETEEIAGCWCCVCVPVGLACFVKKVISRDRLLHQGYILLPFPSFFSEERTRQHNTNGFNNSDPNNVDFYPCSWMACNGPSVSIKLCCC